MPRQAGTKVVPCSKAKCKGKIVAMPGATGTCGKCGTQIKITKKLLAELKK